MRQNLAELKRVLGKRVAELKSAATRRGAARRAGEHAASEKRYYTFWLTSDGRVADFTSYRD